MFEKNDKVLLITRKIVIAIVVILSIASLVVGIILGFTETPLFLLLIPVALFVCYIIWLIALLYMSFLCDIKLIRNKLYNESNANLSVFVACEQISDSNTANTQYNNSDSISTPSTAPKQKTTQDKLKNLQSLLLSGEITDEEYEERRVQLLKEYSLD